MRERKKNRLAGYDYSLPGGYFITICTHNRESLFGEISEGKMILNQIGQIVFKCWVDLINHYRNILLDEFVIMPNHFHSIIWIVGNGLKPCPMELTNSDENGLNVGNGLKPFPTEKSGIENKQNILNKPFPEKSLQTPLPEIIRGFKTFSSRKINETKPPFKFQWQKSYYDRIIRNESELNLIKEYIKNNPMNWKNDDNYI